MLAFHHGWQKLHDRRNSHQWCSVNQNQFVQLYIDILVSWERGTTQHESGNKHVQIVSPEIVHGYSGPFDVLLPRGRWGFMHLVNKAIFSTLTSWVGNYKLCCWAFWMEPTFSNSHAIQILCCWEQGPNVQIILILDTRNCLSLNLVSQCDHYLTPPFQTHAKGNISNTRLVSSHSCCIFSCCIENSHISNTH